mmetsp:Transcript_24822/g.50418  ORF Transcript_24822/g.50418 Transcript_24822/m.50418 type:complete len:92 (-) Transcript_24822:1795-2070(-)
MLCSVILLNVDANFTTAQSPLQLGTKPAPFLLGKPNLRPIQSLQNTPPPSLRGKEVLRKQFQLINCPPGPKSVCPSSANRLSCGRSSPEVL